jgi:hypothetical protein
MEEGEKKRPEGKGSEVQINLFNEKLPFQSSVFLIVVSTILINTFRLLKSTAQYLNIDYFRKGSVLPKIPNKGGVKKDEKEVGLYWSSSKFYDFRSAGYGCFRRQRHHCL